MIVALEIIIQWPTGLRQYLADTTSSEALSKIKGLARWGLPGFRNWVTKIGAFTRNIFAEYLKSNRLIP